MKIQQQNSYNPNMKALYFTKTAPTLSEIVNYKNQKITETGIKYVEDTSAKLTPILKEAFQENSVIKRIADRFDVFVQYLGEHFDISNERFATSASIHVVEQKGNNILSNSYTFAANDKYTPEGARYKLMAHIADYRYINRSTYRLDK